MALRHFRRKLQHTDDSEVSASDDSEQTVSKQDEAVNDESENIEESDDESDSSSSGDDGTLVMIQRPQFLGKSKRQKTAESVEDKEAKRRRNLSERIKQHNQASKARENTEAELKANLGTEDELVRRIILLDDNDSLNCEKERQEWLERCTMRQKLRRDALLAKQLELEQYEASKLDRGGPAIDDEDLSGTGDVGIRAKSARSASVFSKGSNSRWKPSRAQNPQFSQSAGMPEQREETEYSYI